MAKILVSLFGIGAAVVAFGAYNFMRPPAEPSVPIQTAVAPTSLVNATDQRVFELQPGASEARFVVDEVLRGSPRTVVGETDQVAGQIQLDADDADAARASTIVINARTITTDDTQRTRTLQNQILETGQHEFIAFTPRTYAGLPPAVQAGQSYAFDITGDLSIRGVTRQATFNVTLTPVSDTELEGKASTTVRYADWGVSIPSVPFVASVGDQVQLQLDFTALAA